MFRHISTRGLSLVFIFVETCRNFLKIHVAF
ncbi:hypothetical protein [Thermoanaerobacter thermohydrosulfuricus]